MARRLRRARARGRRHEPHARRSRARGRPRRSIACARSTGHDVHLAGYSQGGMFCYQAAAFRKRAGLASVITMGSPVDLHRTLQRRRGRHRAHRRRPARRAVVAARAHRGPARHVHVDRLQAAVGAQGGAAARRLRRATSTIAQALEKREAKRLFLGGEGFVAWPGPGVPQVRRRVIVGNRMASGGFVIDGHTVTLADLDVPDPRTSSAAATRWAAPARCAASGAPRRSVDVDVRGARSRPATSGSSSARPR